MKTIGNGAFERRAVQEWEEIVHLGEVGIDEGWHEILRRINIGWDVIFEFRIRFQPLQWRKVSSAFASTVLATNWWDIPELVPSKR